MGQILLTADGTVQTSGVSITVRGQGGAEGAGGGTIVYGSADNTVYYTPTQAESDYTSFVVIAYKAACISQDRTIVTTASSTSGTVESAGTINTLDGLNNLSIAQLATELTDALRNDTLAEVASVPAANASIADKINWIFALARNKGTQTATTKTLLADDESTPIATSTISTDGVTFVRGEWS